MLQRYNTVKERSGGYITVSDDRKHKSLTLCGRIDVLFNFTLVLTKVTFTENHISMPSTKIRLDRIRLTSNFF